LMISLLLCSMLTYAARPEPSESKEFQAENYEENPVG